MDKEKNQDPNSRLVAENRKARFDYHFEETFEAGLVLTGTEVKSLRLGQCSLGEGHVGPKDDALYLLNAHIPELVAIPVPAPETPRVPSGPKTQEL